MFTLLLLLRLLLARIHHPPLCQCNRLAQHVEIADVIGKDQNQRRIEIGALFVAQSAMRLDDGTKPVVRFCKIRAGRQRHDKRPQLNPLPPPPPPSSANRATYPNPPPPSPSPPTQT